MLMMSLISRFCAVEVPDELDGAPLHALNLNHSVFGVFGPKRDDASLMNDEVKVIAIISNLYYSIIISIDKVK